jgi:hypothetical protein
MQVLFVLYFASDNFIWLKSTFVSPVNENIMRKKEFASYNMNWVCILDRKLFFHDIFIRGAQILSSSQIKLSLAKNRNVNEILENYAMLFVICCWVLFLVGIELK